MGRREIVNSARIVIFVVGPASGSAIGQSLLGSGKGVGQSGPFTVGNRPCDCCSGDYKMLCDFGGWVASGGSKRRAEQQAYEERLDEAMKRVQAERER